MRRLCAASFLRHNHIRQHADTIIVINRLACELFSCYGYPCGDSRVQGIVKSASIVPILSQFINGSVLDSVYDVLAIDKQVVEDLRNILICGPV